MKPMKLVLFLTVITLLLHSCSKKSGKDFDSDPFLYRDYITSFSSGLISTKADIQVGLAFTKKEWQVNHEIDNNYFTVSPSAEGKVLFLQDNKIAFRPAKRLKQDTEYQVTLHLSKFIKVADSLSDFNFTVKTLKQDFLVTTQDLQSYNRDMQYLNASVKTSDNMDLTTAKKLVTVTHNGKKLPLRFDNNAGSSSEFHFIIDSIQRGAQDSNLKIAWNGKPYDIAREGDENYVVPGKDNFKVLTVQPAEGDNQTLLINFSDPIRKDQDFSGLVAVQGVQSLKYAVDGNLLKVFFGDPLNGNFLVEVFQGIESTEGFKTKQSHTENISFEQLKPEVRFVKSGTILPASSNLKINFEAVNLSAVDVKVYRIFENNVMQFLQDNEMESNYGLRNVALPVAKTKLVLNTNKMVNYAKWNTFAIDLSKLVKPEPGAIYHIEIAMRPAYSLYKCEDSNVLKEADEQQDEQEEEREEDFTDYEDYNYYHDDYEWEQRENPCSTSYYYDRQVETNVLASDLGVIAKKGENNSFFFAVASITTTQPISGASVELFNLQRQKLGSAVTSAEGTVMLSSDKKPFFAIIKKGSNTTYVKLNEGNAQSVSNFDVDGAQLQKGLKGYIYGERGVWRPGDTLYLGFILNDKAAKLPASHPIKLRLSDPNGKMMFQAVQSYNQKNHFKFVVTTQASAPTGNWEAMVSVGGAHFYKSIKIETIKPNRLKIKNGFEGKTLSANAKTTGNLQVLWLHGAIAKGLKVEMQAKFIKQKTDFKGYLNYIFDDPAQNFSTEEVNIYSGVTDDNGNATVTLEPKLKARAPGLLKAAIITKAYEKGGDFSTDVIQATYSPYDTYVGVKLPQGNKYGMLETGKSNRVDVATVNEAGKPKGGRRLEVKVYAVEWRWWWDASHDNVSSYSNAVSNTPFYSQSLVTDASGKASFNFKTDEEQWGNYLIRVTDAEGGHSAGSTVLIDYPYWSGRTRNNSGEEAKMLMFSTDKEKYAVGENAIVSFPSSEGGRALVSLENGSRVVKTYWAPTTKGETQVTIPVTAAMAPNVYINITLLQPHANTANDSPIRLYGIVPIEVVDKNTILQPQISMAAVLKPEQKTTIKVSEKTGKAMTYTVAIVDDGLLDLTRFKTPNAWDSFYAKEALGVKTWDIYDDVIGAYGGQVNQIFSIGGDADLGGGQAKKANRFKPVVIYMGPYTIGKGETRVHTIKLPKYVGSVRTMVVAANADASAYGSAEKTTPVRSPLMLLASLPRKVTPKEKVTLPVTLFAMENSIKNVTLQVKTNNGFRIIGASKQTVSFERPDEKVAYFDLEVNDLIGLGKVTVTATSGKEKASYDVELDIMNPNPVTQNYKEVILEPGKQGTINWASFGVTGTNKARLEVSSFPPMDFNRRLDYLIQYPHGCVEQTTSSVFPQLYLADIADVDATRKSKIQRNVTAAIQRLGQFQVASGGFAYWPGNPEADDWGTSYAGHFFIEAEKKGYALPLNAKKQWLSYQQKTARAWRYYKEYHNDFAQAYRLYTLALAGSPDLSSMNRLRETPGIGNESKLRLAAAYALAGQKNVGQQLLSQSTIDGDSDYNYYYYGSPERNRAMALETLIVLGQKGQAFTMATKLAKEMSSNQWMSTQTTAYCLYAMSKFAQGNGTKGIDISYTNKGKTLAISTPKTFADRVLELSSNNAVTIKNNKQSTLYVKVVYSGVLPVGEEQTEERGLATGIVFKDRGGKVINPSSLAQGTEFVAEVTISNIKGEFVDNVALTQIIPSGWEIVNTRFTDFGSFAENKVDYTDIRDDRTNFYFSLKSNETKTFRILLNASYLGSYYLPGVQCEAMYDNSFLARTKGQWVKVVR
ncbi:membrane protein [Flavobacterium rivuli WB 3.3-2 = DSM 21788]|uniref:Membrane protein n=2 Tax=Flavobacterium rivuli TaxID=498301 RepID=A0A0A2MFZ1_9FLAO|nr:MG2 domain-containing protein [Flavobacterium rivuli]KGO87205.1 membrane protein [Flavobacterium rivuli WB 3.3-2 = DSM 21788]